MRLDHIAYRVKDRDAAVVFFEEAFGYKRQAEFEIDLEDGSKARCMALEPGEKSTIMAAGFQGFTYEHYHMPPEVFVSSGPPGSLIDRWVQDWGRGVGGIHHLAYEVNDVEAVKKEWIAKGLMFTTKDPLDCEDLTQIFSKPHPFTGIIYEFITRKGAHGFCKTNVGKLMNSTSDLA